MIEEIEAAESTIKYGAKMVWRHAPEPWSWHIAETNASYAHTYQVWRPTFDQMLLCNVAANSVDAHEGRRIVDVAFESGEPNTVTHESLSRHTETYQSDWIVSVDRFLARVSMSTLSASAIGPTSSMVATTIRCAILDAAPQEGLREGARLVSNSVC